MIQHAPINPIDSVGPPMDLDAAIMIVRLEGDALYTAAMVARTANDGNVSKNEYQRLRRNFKRFSNYHLLNHDGYVGRYRAWFGRHWKEALRPQDYRRALQAIAGLSCDRSGSQLRGRRFLSWLWERWRGLTITAAVRRGMVALLLVGLASTLAFQWSPVQSGYWLLKQEGPAAAYGYFSDLAKTKKTDSDLLFGLAWAAYRNQMPEKAEVIGQYLLDRYEDPNLCANVWFMLGYLNADQGKYLDAYGAFHQALSFYEYSGNEKNTHRTLLGLARVAMNERDRLLANRYLDEAGQHLAGGFTLQNYYQMRAWLAFEGGDYEKALDYSYQRLEWTEDTPSDLGQALSGLGFCLMLVGRTEEGLKKTLEAEIQIVAALNQQDYYYNLLNKVLYFRCQGDDYAIMAEAINTFASNHKDQMLLDHLAFILAFDCNGTQKESRKSR